MLKAYRKNRSIRIADEKQDEYRALGYTVCDMDGKVLAKPDDDKAHIQELEAENQALKKQLAALQEKDTPGRKGNGKSP